MYEDERTGGPRTVNLCVEAATTQQPGHASTEEMTRYVAAERRPPFCQSPAIIWTIPGILEILLALCFALTLIPANPEGAFAGFVYGITGPLAAPFTSLVGTPRSEGALFDVTTLIAMGAYVLFFWVVVRAPHLLADRPSPRMVTRSAGEQAPSGGSHGGGAERTTRTIHWG